MKKKLLTLRFDYSTPIVLSFFAIILFGLGFLMLNVSYWYFTKANIGTTIFTSVVGLVFIVFALGLMRLMFLRIRFDASTGVLTLPNEGANDTDPDVYKYSVYSASSIFQIGPFIFRSRRIPVGRVKSALICRQNHLKDFIEKYGDEAARKKLSEYIRYKADSARGGHAGSYSGSFGAIATGAVVGSAGGAIVSMYETPPWQLVVETTDGLLIRDLSLFFDSDPPYLAEVLRASGVTVLNARDEKIAEQVAAGTLLPKRVVLTLAMKLFLVMLVCLVLFVVVMYNNP